MLGSTKAAWRSNGVSCISPAMLHSSTRHRCQRRAITSYSSISPEYITATEDVPREVDVVVIGSGVGGLSCAAMLCRYGYEVLVVESHTTAGGAAHHWSRRQFNFDSGAALFSGINPAIVSSGSGGTAYKTTANPLSSVLAAIDETVPGVIDLNDSATCLVYPDGKQYRTQLGSEKFVEVVEERLGSDAAREWTAFQESVNKLCVSAGAIPPAAVRLDPAVAWTAAFRRPAAFLRYTLGSSGSAGKTFADVMDGTVTRPDVRRLITMITEGTCSAPPAEVDAAYMLRAFHEMWGPSTQLQYPQHGSQAIVDTLVHGVNKFGGHVALGFHVTSILPEGAGSQTAGSEVTAAVPAIRPVAAAVAMSPPIATAACSGSPGPGTAAQPHGAGGSRSVATGASTNGSSGSSMFGWPMGPGTVEGDKAGGVEVRAADGSTHSVRARHAVVCNASVWDTVGLLDAGGMQGGIRAGVAAELAEEATLRSMAAAGGREGLPDRGSGGNGAPGGDADVRGTGYVTGEAFEEYVRDLEMNESMMHLHVGFTAREGEDLPFHTYFLESPHTGRNGWPTIVIPSTAASGLAPPGHHVLHATMSEPYDPWEGLSRTSPEYRRLKEERAATLWGFVRQIIPDIDGRVVMSSVGTPATHARFLRRKRGTYGPANLLTLTGALPQAVKPLGNVFCCGDSVFPGAGTPAVAANGMWVANTLVPVGTHTAMLDDIGV
eukprot:jgi/Ulvmu1/3303/UM153_0015.1